MIDTHTHLYPSDSFPGDEAALAIRRAIEAGVDRMILPNVDVASLAPIEAMQQLFPENVFIAPGIHPTELSDCWVDDLREIEAHISHSGVVAIGEVGIDLYWDASRREEQIEAFAAQLELAAAKSLPVLIHQRAALQDTLATLAAADLKRIPTIVFHCFTEGPDSVKAIRETVPEALFGIGGVCTFKNAGQLTAAIPEIGIDHIVLETDAPYLAPVPHRGTRNESAYLPVIAAKVADILGFTTSEVNSVTTRTVESRLLRHSL